MYLLIAECSYDENPEMAKEHMNLLRRNRIRGNQEGAYDLMYLSKKDIFDEMRREYIGEGQMWYVYKRNHLSLPGGHTGTIEADNDILYFLSRTLKSNRGIGINVNS